MGALVLVRRHRFRVACGRGEHQVISHIEQKPVAGVSMLLSHTSGKHGRELEISPCDCWDTLWTGSHHMIMDAIAFSSTTHAVIPLVRVVALNCLLKGFRQGASSSFFNWPLSSLPYSSRGTGDQQGATYLSGLAGYRPL
jgi:hypothetical protein